MHCAKYSPYLSMCSGQIRLWHDFLLPRRPAGPYDARDYFFQNPKPAKSSGALIRDPLIDTMELRVSATTLVSPLFTHTQHQETEQSAYTIERLLTALWHAEYQFRFNYYRTGMIMLADIGLELGMTKRSQQIVESILPQVLRAASYTRDSRSMISRSSQEMTSNNGR